LWRVNVSLTVNVRIALSAFRYAARFVSGILDYKVIIDSYVPMIIISPHSGSTTHYEMNFTLI